MAHNASFKRTKNYFFFKLGFSEEAFKKVMAEYCQQFGKITTNKYDDVCTEIQKDWNYFMHWWGTAKHKFKDEYFKNKFFNSRGRYSRKNEVYNEWNDIREALQYTNGCTDDF